MSELLFPVVVVFAGYLVFGITGFGSALTIVPLLAWRLPLTLIVPLVLVLDLVASAQLGQLNFRAIRVDEIKRLLPGLVLGTFIGLQLGETGSAPLLLVALGAYVIWAGLAGLRTHDAAARMAPGWALPFSLGSGVVEALFGTSGPLLVAYLTRRLHDPQALRATIASAILAVVILTLAGYGLTGRLAQPALLDHLPPLLLATVTGCFCGHHLAERLQSGSPILLRRLICGLLVVSGSTLALHAVP